jgi:hypothetical protein
MVKRIKRKQGVRKLSVPKAKKPIGTRRFLGAHGSRRRMYESDPGYFTSTTTTTTTTTTSTTTTL